jgi:hypothetical protein
MRYIRALEGPHDVVVLPSSVCCRRCHGDDGLLARGLERWQRVTEERAAPRSFLRSKSFSLTATDSFDRFNLGLYILMGYSYGAVRAPNPQPALFIANDDDWEAEMLQQGDELAAEQEVYYEEQADYDEAEESHVISLKLSDVPESAYWDEAALTNCWTSALADYKVRSQLSLSLYNFQLTRLLAQQFQHPSNFGPPREAPRTQLQKHNFAPLSV